ncbi:MAG: SPOR domain-containing protein [Candidatus Puniceispirillaceae bacterium]
MVVGEMSDIAPPKKSRFARLFIIIILLSMLGGGGWAAWTYIVQPPPENSPVVLRADPTPFRVKPADGTQTTIPNQDSTFMNLIDGTAEANQNSEVISLSDPAPEPPPVAVTKPKDETAQLESENNSLFQDTDVQKQQFTQKAETDNKQFADVDARTSDGQSDTDNAQENATGPEVEQKKLDLTAALNASAMPAPRPKVTKSGQVEMMVQLAAFRKEDKAKTAAALLNQKHANRLRGHQLDVRSIKSTDGQVFWRVITDPIPKQDALSICDGLKRAGQDCIIRQTKAQKP